MNLFSLALIPLLFFMKKKKSKEYNLATIQTATGTRYFIRLHFKDFDKGIEVFKEKQNDLDYLIQIDNQPFYLNHVALAILTNPQLLLGILTYAPILPPRKE